MYQEEEVIEEEIIEEEVPARVYQSQVSEQSYVASRPESVSYSNFRADEYKSNNNVYSNASVVSEDVVSRNSYAPYRG